MTHKNSSAANYITTLSNIVSFLDLRSYGQMGKPSLSTGTIRLANYHRLRSVDPVFFHLQMDT